MFVPVILLSLFFSPDVQLQRGIAMSRQRDYEASESLLLKVLPEKVEREEVYHFWRLLNAYSLNDRKAAEKHFELLEDCFTFQRLPERHRVLAALMVADMETWKVDDVGDISRDMRTVRDRLDNSKCGKSTQKMEKQIISKLDRLIKQAEAAKADKEKKEQEKQEKQQKQEQEGSGSQDQSRPMDDSHIGQPSGIGVVDEKKVREVAHNWGKLPPKERAAAMVELGRGLPPKYRQAIEAYFAALNRKQRAN